METVYKFFNFLVKCFSIDESRALHKNNSFWFALLTPAIIALLLGLNLTRELVIHERFDFGFTAEHLDSFIKYYKFPIGLLPISILLSVMVARFHASKQTVQQTHLKNYFEHYSFFEAFCTDLKKEHSVDIDIRKLYLTFYKRSTLTNFFPYPDPHIAVDYIDTLAKINAEYKANMSVCMLSNIAMMHYVPIYESSIYIKTLDGDDLFIWARNMKEVVYKLYSFQGNNLDFSSIQKISEDLDSVHSKFKSLMSDRP